MEGTMLRSFCGGASLRHYLHAADLDHLNKIHKIYMKRLEPLAAMRSFIPSLAQASLETSKLQDLGNIWPSNVENWESWPSLGILCSRIQHEGLVYTTQIKSAKDCNITFRSNSTGGAAVGQIQAIIEAEKAGSSAPKLYVIMKEYC